MRGNDVILELKGLKVYFPVTRGIFKRVIGYIKAVDGVNLVIHRGETLGLVGESGCGKSTLGRSILRLVEPLDSEILYSTEAPTGGERLLDILKLDARELKGIRREISIIFQDPYSSLNPRMTVADIIGEPLKIHGVRKSERRERIAELLETVGLRAVHMNRYPHEFSGGQRQRISIARALALNPRFVIADEPVSALDVSIQAQILNLLEDLQVKFGLTYLFISHNLAVMEHISDRIAVMYLGKIVEFTAPDSLYKNPLHPYTEALLSAIPIPEPDYKRERILLAGNVPSPLNPPSGCNFHTRCMYSREICAREEPEFKELEAGHWVACHRATELELKGILLDRG